MKNAGLIAKPRRGYSKITDRGLSVLRENPETISSKFLERYPEFVEFRALQGKKARKGIFITTSDFSKQARDYASAIESSVVLVDGETLAGLMIDHDVGTTVGSSYEIKRVDSDYFAEA